MGNHFPTVGEILRAQRTKIGMTVERAARLTAASGHPEAFDLRTRRMLTREWYAIESNRIAPRYADGRVRLDLAQAAVALRMTRAEADYLHDAARELPPDVQAIVALRADWPDLRAWAKERAALQKTVAAAQARRDR